MTLGWNIWRLWSSILLSFYFFLDASNDTSTDDNDEHLTEKESLIKKILELQRTVEDVENKVKKVRCQFYFLNSDKGICPILICNIYFWLTFGLANTINYYWMLKIHVVCAGNF